LRVISGISFHSVCLASSVMGPLLTFVWLQSRLSLYTELRLYNALVVSVLLSYYMVRRLSQNQTHGSSMLLRSDACDDSLEYAGMTS